MQSITLVRAGVCAALVTLLSACAPASYAVRNPAPSGLAFVANGAAPTTLALADSRAGSERTFFSGILPSTLTVDNVPLDAAGYLARNLEAELASRGTPTRVDAAGTTFPRLDLKGFRIQNHRASAYSPFVTFTLISGDLETAAGKKRLGVFVKRGKVPVWSFNEIIEPTLNQPLSLAVKELATKVGAQLYSARSADTEVDRLVAKLGTRNDDSYLDVYALGFTNNTKAVPALTTLVRDNDEYVRLAAISSLGTLGASDQFDLLKSVYRDAGMWQDRAMAIKAIAELGTADAQAFVTQEQQALKARADQEASWTLQVIGLYM